MTPLHYSLEEFLYIVRGDGCRSKRYRHWCARCFKDRGYGYKNKVIKEALCHSCKMKDPHVLAKISRHSKLRKHTEKSKQQISNSLYARYGSNPTNRKLAINIRGRLNQAIRGQYKSGSAISALGCSISELKTHLESKFQPGMSWENYGKNGWHIDHIIPLCKFNLANSVEFNKACHYSNLQPLWQIDNLNKRHIDGTFK